MNKEVKIVLFESETSSDLRIEYPELAEMEEFSSLKVKEVRLCWLVGCRTSPIYNMSDKKSKLFKALEIVYGKSFGSREDLQEMIEGNIPDHIKAGINKMETFNPEYRLRAKLMTQYMFEVLNDMIIVNKEQIRTMDVDEKKKYADLVVKISSELPTMVKTLETSYGAKTVDVKTEKKVLIGINDILR